MLSTRSEIQRQRRSRQLEETQRLLDGQHTDFNLAGSAGQSLAPTENGQDYQRRRRENESVQSRHSKGNGERSIAGNGTPDDQMTTHSVISQKNLGRIHERYQRPADYEHTDGSVLTNTGELNSHHNLGAINSKNASSKHNIFENTSENEIRFESRIKARRSESSASEHSHRRSMRENDVHSNLREKQMEGRGRGRGRRKSNVGSSVSGLEELPQSSKAIVSSSSTARAPRHVVHDDEHWHDKNHLLSSRQMSPINRKSPPPSYNVESGRPSNDNLLPISFQSYIW